MDSGRPDNECKIKEVIPCRVGNAEIAATPLKPMPLPINARLAGKNVNFWIIPAIRPTASTRARMIGSSQKVDHD
jgi:hypothetical protein